MNIEIPSLIICAGKPKSGKSHLIKYIIYKYRHKFQYGIVMCKTSFNDGYDYIPEDFVHSKYDENKIKNLMKLQSKLIENGIINDCFLILDDCLTCDYNKELFTDLITQYRHYHITVIISTQYIYKVNPTIRECANYAMLFRQSTKRSIEAVYESFGAHFDNYESFKQYITNNTDDHKFIFVDINSDQDDIDNIYQVMKAPKKIPKFLLKFSEK